MSEWKPIESAPKDRTCIIARGADGVRRAAWFEYGKWNHITWGDGDDHDECETENQWVPVEWYSEPPKGVTNER